MFSRQLLGLFLLLLMISCSEQDYRGSELGEIQTKSIKEHPYWSRVYSLKDSDSVQLDVPVELSFEFVLEDLLSFETNKPNYILKSSLYAYHDKEIAYELNNGDTLFFMPDRTDLFQVSHPENDYLKQTPWNYDGTFEGEAQFSKYLETEMYHNWDMTRYPFDVQMVTLRIESLQDSSLVRIRDSKVFPPNFSQVRNLRRGFNIDTILFNETFEETTIYDEDLGRNDIRSIGEFHILISRKNSWLFLKLFSGGLIAMFISWLAFFIRKDKFDSRIEISVGSIFASVGNKYFVDSAISSEILTVADVINNLFIFFVVINTFYIVYVQRHGDDRWWLKPISMFAISLIFSMLTTVSVLLLA